MKSTPTSPQELYHRMTLEGRNSLRVQGVTEVLQFDETAALMKTGQGRLLVQGRGLTLKALSPDGGQVAVEGHICALSYEEPKADRGIIRRLLG